MHQLSRRDFLRAGVAAAAVGTASTLLPDSAYARPVGAPAAAPSGPAATPPSAPSTGHPFLPYTSDSYFKSAASTQAVDTARTVQFRTFMKTFPDQRGTAYPTINGTGTNRWGTAFAMGASSDPIWKLSGNVNKYCQVLSTTGFHAPDWLGTVLSGTSDSPFCVVDTASGFTVFGTKASVSGSRTISVASAGITYHSSNGLDRRDPLSNDARNNTSRGRISDAMVIRKDLVDYGIANNTGLGHVLHMFFVETLSAAGYCNPMVGCEGNQNGWGAEGDRLAIDASVDLTKRGLSPAGLVVARTLQTNGCYIGDNAGSGSAVKAEQESSGHPVWGGALNRNSLQGITWDDFVVLKRS